VPYVRGHYRRPSWNSHAGQIRIALIILAVIVVIVLLVHR
jgi:hypothetical protein